MPEFGDYLNATEKLRMAVVTKTPRELAVGYRAYRSGEYDLAKAEELMKTLFSLIFEIHGPVGAAEFMQEATR